MTTIATDGRTIAADGRRTRGPEITHDHETKLHVIDGEIFAFTGDFAAFEPAVAWYRAGKEPGRQPSAGPEGSWSLLVIGRDGVLRRYSHALPYAEWMPYPITFGSGADYAMGAMEAGKSPREAVEIAARRDIYTGGEIMVIDIEATLAASGLAPEKDASASVLEAAE